MHFMLLPTSPVVVVVVVVHALQQKELSAQETLKLVIFILLPEAA